MSALFLLSVGHSILAYRMVARIKKMVSLILKRVEGEYGTLHVRHFGVEIEYRPFRESAQVEGVVNISCCCSS